MQLAYSQTRMKAHNDRVGIQNVLTLAACPKVR